MSESPFKGISKQKDTELSLSQKIYEIFASEIRGHIPSETIKSMPPQYAVFLGFLLILLIFGSFLALFATSFVSSLSSTFLAPGSNSTEYCSTVEIFNTGTYLADNQGRWQGQPNFTYTLSKYSFSVVGMSTSFENYQYSLERLYTALVDLGKVTAVNNLAYNLLIWMSSVFLMSEDNLSNIASMNSNPNTIFNRQYLDVTLSNKNGNCNATTLATFNSGSGITTASIDPEEFAANEECKEIVDLSYLGYINGSSTFSLQFDVRSLITAVAINNGILDISDTSLIPGLSSAYQNPVTGENYTVGYYIDFRYSDMQPIACITLPGSDKAKSICAFIFGEVYAYPFFEHAGNSTTIPEYCDCSKLSVSDLYFYSNCNAFRFIYGLIFWNTDSPNALFKLTYYNGAMNITRNAFNAAYSGSYFGKSTPYEYYRSPQFLNESYQFCYDDEYGYCSMLIFSSFDLFQSTWSVSEYQYQLSTGACSDSITIPKYKWDRLIETPFTNLVQDYVSCTSPPETVFFSSLGIAMGNISSFSPAIVAFFLVLVYAYSKLFNVVIPMSYTDSTKKEALDALAVALLLARDKKIDMSLEKYAPLRKLVASLEAAADIDTYSTNPYDSTIDWLAFSRSFQSRISNDNNNNNNNSSSTATNRSMSSTIPNNSVVELRSVSRSKDGSNRIVLNDFPSENKALKLTVPTSKDGLRRMMQSLYDRLVVSRESRTNGREFWESIVDTKILKECPDELFYATFRRIRVLLEGDEDTGVDYLANPSQIFSNDDFALVQILRQLMVLHGRSSLGKSEADLISQTGMMLCYLVGKSHKPIFLYQLDAIIQAQP